MCQVKGGGKSTDREADAGRRRTKLTGSTCGGGFGLPSVEGIWVQAVREALGGGAPADGRPGVDCLPLPAAPGARLPTPGIGLTRPELGYKAARARIRL